VIKRQHLYIDGTWREPIGSGQIDVLSACTGEVMGSIPDGSEADASAAVVAARTAFEPWSQTPMGERLDLLRQLEEGLTKRVDELADVITSEVGTPLRVSRRVQVEAAIASLTNFRELLPELPLEEEIGSSVVVREPIGVVACITSWNYPLQQMLGKIGAAMATGCTTVLKPPQVAPLSAFVVADLIDEIGFPAGVFNLVSGAGRGIGVHLVDHPDVDMIHFTGSTVAGRAIGAAAAQSVKKVALELGGKSASIVLEDADLAQAVKVSVANCFTNTGQTCTAWTRLVVPRSRLAEIEQLVCERVARYRLGDPFDADTNMGPLASVEQQRSVLRFIDEAREDGARLITGGTDTPPTDQPGFFVAPTVFSDVSTDMRLAQEEVFGPVLAIMPYDTEDEAVEIANSTIYGLAGGVWSGDSARAERVARRIRTGQIDINGSFFNPVAPFGGYKQSGIGRELGLHGLSEFYELKSIQHA